MTAPNMRPRPIASSTAPGRVANVDTLDLAAGKVEHANGRVALDRHLRSTSNPDVYVCGDAVPTSPQLSPIATYEGDIVGRNIVEGPKYSPDYASMATSVYTVPALASVGLTEAAARQKGFAIDVHTNDMHDWFSAQTYAETVAWSKVIVDQIDRPHPRRAFRRSCRPGTGQYLRPGDALWHHRRPDPGQRLRLSDVFLRHQAHARPRLAA